MSSDPRTRVLVNAVAARRGGGAHHLNPFVVGLADELPGGDIEVLITADAPTPANHPRVRWTVVDVPSGVNLRRLWWDNVTVPRLARFHDVLISPLNFGPLWSPRPHLLFQRNALYFDPRYTRTLGRWERVKLGGYRLLGILQSNTATSVLVPSQSMADLLGRHLLHRSKIIVSPHRIDVTRCNELALRPVLPSAAAWVLRDMRLLHVGTPSAHKGLDTLAETFIGVANGLKNADVGLAVTFDRIDPSPVVGRFVERVDAAGLLDQVSFLGSVPHDEVFPLYQQASALLLPSAVESFGFPVLEAIAVGCPVVCSDLPALREVAVGVDDVRYHRVGDAGGAAELALAIGSQSVGEREDLGHVAQVDQVTASQVSIVGQWVMLKAANSIAVTLGPSR